MGDRGNIAVIQDDEPNGSHQVWIYSHWGGEGLPVQLRDALAKRWRWSDSSYLTRIIIDAVMDGQHGEETGFGVSCQIQDNEHDILVVDCRNQTVFTIEESELKAGRVPEKYKPRKKWTFEEFASEVDNLPQI